MSKKRTPQTLQKRQRERDKQMRKMEKIARRLERRSQKRQAKQGDGPLPAAPPESVEERVPEAEGKTVPIAGGRNPKG